ncbi:glycosyltransferase family 2 protein [Buttiauxella sp. A2-C2_NF]|uniref:glycosyltransferase n=1 Tax=Buttiauxella ferragutiae TaxID=82989 RepID=UPI001E3BCAE8|nr:glycosyltransferase [Buttiauxella ferragutiae]MCE0826699.1 glycosyltransferase family 2 protein [Buttiauxella ferragutiae]
MNLETMHSILLIDTVNNDDKDVILTIAIPTYKRKALLRETLTKVFSLKFKIKIEVIIVDNDPGDINDAVDLMNDFVGQEFLYYKNIENYGAVGNWNQCLKLAKGKLITILHDDDFLNSNFPYEIENFIRRYNNLDDFTLIGFDSEFMDQREIMIEEKNDLFTMCKKYFYILKSHYKKRNEGAVSTVTIQDVVLFGNAGFTATLGVVMNREKALSLKGFNESWYPIMDYEFYSRWALKYKEVFYKNTVVSTYRIFENMTMRNDVLMGIREKNYKLRLHIFKQDPSLKWVPSYSYLLDKWDAYALLKNWNKETKESAFVPIACRCLVLLLRPILKRFG